jgi:DinB superfamily
MVNRLEWFKRQFSFELPVEMYPNVLERVRGTPARLEDLARSLTPETLTRRDRDKWSIQEHAGHLLDLEPLGMSRLDDYEAGRETLHAADMSNQRTYEANHNADTIENILAAFRKERKEFVRRLENYDEALLQKTALHPRLQAQIRIIDLAFFIAEHDDHHLARISELKRLFAEKEYLDAASQVRQDSEERKHSDSTEVIAEDRKR